ncbi:MAG: transporter [Pseudomonadota bacterium]
MIVLSVTKIQALLVVLFALISCVFVLSYPALSNDGYYRTYDSKKSSDEIKKDNWQSSVSGNTTSGNTAIDQAIHGEKLRDLKTPQTVYESHTSDHGKTSHQGPASTHADHSPHQNHVSEHSSEHGTHGARAPIGVMGDHLLHKKGQWMLSYRHMYMNMEGNRIGDDDISPERIVTTVPNRFSGQPMQPPTLRVVPTEMDMHMNMFGGMYAAADNVTLMAMVNYHSKEMDHITFAGGMGTTQLGRFTTQTEGFGDVKLSALVALYEDDIHKVHLNLGLSIPTGSITEKDKILTPMGMTPEVRLPYAMQLGTGTFDALPGITYTGQKGDFSWGAQYKGSIPLEDENDEGYRYSDKHEGTAWVAYQWAPWISTSLRVAGSTQDSIDGIDSEIVAPVQTADPDNYGGERIDLLFGVSMAGQQGALSGHRFAFEIGTPIYQDLNGPQMETDLILTVGWQKAF